MSDEEWIKGRFQDLVESATTRIMEDAERDFRVARQACGSPIEERMLLELQFAPTSYWLAPHALAPKGLRWTPSGRYERLLIVPQMTIGRYRVDFAVIADSPFTYDRYLTVIECDGHEFHERSKQQAARDKKRDRFLSSEGWSVLRFTGAEIHNNPQDCIEEFTGHIEEWANRLREKGNGDA